MRIFRKEKEIEQEKKDKNDEQKMRIFRNEVVEQEK